MSMPLKCVIKMNHQHYIQQILLNNLQIDINYISRYGYRCDPIWHIFSQNIIYCSTPPINLLN